MLNPKKTAASLSDKFERAADVLETRVEEAAQETREIAPLVAQAQGFPWWGHAKRFWPFMLITLGGVAFFSSGIWKQLQLEKITENYHFFEYWSNTYPLLARVILVATMVLVVALGMPGSVVLVIAGGMFFGSLQSALYATLADGISGSLLFLAGRRALNYKRPASDLVARLRTGFAAHPVSYSLFLRLVPLFPYAAISVALAWLGCSYRMFVATSMVGVFPALLVYSALGAGLSDTIIQNENFNTSLLAQPKFLVPLIGLATLSLAPVFLGLRRSPRIPR